MRHPKIALVLSLVISAGATQHALSDGMYVPSARPTFNWSGVYLGATAGYANGFHSFDDLAGAFLGYPGLANDQSQGFAGGGTLGINWQDGSLVYGLETDIDWLSNKSSYVDPNGAINNFYPSETNRLDYLGTVRGRVGLAVDRTLLYVHSSRGKHAVPAVRGRSCMVMSLMASLSRVRSMALLTLREAMCEGFRWPGKTNSLSPAASTAWRNREATRELNGTRCALRFLARPLGMVRTGECESRSSSAFLAAAISVRLRPVSSASRTMVAMVGDMEALPSSMADQSRRMSSGLAITSRG
jgi:hypothetical protein